MVKRNEGIMLGIALDLHCRRHNPVSRKDNYFEACMEKLEFILKNCDVLIQAGDVFTKAREEDICKNRMLSLFNKYRKPIFIVPGNHDVENNQVETLMQTSLGNLAAHESVTILTPDRIWDIAGLRVGVLDYDIKVAKQQEFSSVDLVVGHHFYNWTRDLEQSIVPEDVEKYNADYIFLGHDHEPHPIERVGRTSIYRFGSVMRGELNAYVENHKPCFAVMKIKDTICSEPELIEIPHADFKDVFRWDEKKDFKKCTKLISEIKNFLENLNVQPADKKSIREILKEDLKAPQNVVDYLDVIYRINHVPF